MENHLRSPLDRVSTGESVTRQQTTRRLRDAIDEGEDEFRMRAERSQRSDAARLPDHDVHGPRTAAAARAQA